MRTIGVCVGSSASVSDQDPINSCFSRRSNRLCGGNTPETDSHRVIVEAISCDGDFDGDRDSCSRVNAGAIVLPPGAPLDKVPLRLKDREGDVFFAGTFDASHERLVGKIHRGRRMPSSVKDPMADVAVQLTCVSLPRLTLGIANMVKD